MTKATKKKIEKYIYRRVSAAGSVSFELWIRKQDNKFHESFAAADYGGSERFALDSCRRKKNEILHKIDIGKSVAADSFPLVGELFKKSYELIPVEYSTEQRHKIYFRKVFQPYKDIPINKITVADIQQSVNTYATTTEDNHGNKGHTRKETGKMLAVWRRIFKTAQMLEYDVSDKTAAVQLPAGIQPVHRSIELSMDDFRTFCTALLKYNATSISGTYDCKAVYYALVVMLYTGLRPAETYALSKDDIDLKKWMIFVRSSVRRDSVGDPVIGNTKTEQSIRAVPIPEDLKPVITEILEWSMYDRVFSRYGGALLTSSWVNTLKGNVIRKNKLDIDFRPYQLRHQFSTDLFRNGVPAPTVRDLMGHSGSGMTLDYATSNENDRKKALNERKISTAKQDSDATKKG